MVSNFNNKYLFYIIKTLNKGEKRYIKQFAKLQSDNPTYIKLMDAIEQQNEYDEKKLKLLLSKIIKKENFSQTKQYLTNLILKALRNYNSEKSILFEVTNGFQNIEILKSKSLPEEALIQCDRIIKRSRESSIMEFLAYSTRIKKNLLLSHRSHKEYAHEIAEVLTASEAINQELQEINSYFNLSIRIQDTHAAHDKIPSYLLSKEIDELTARYKINKVPASLRSKEVYYQLLYTISFAKFDFVNAYINLKKKIDVYAEMGESPFFRAENRIASMLNLAKIAAKNKRVNEALQIIENTKQLCYVNESFNILSFEGYMLRCLSEELICYLSLKSRVSCYRQIIYAKAFLKTHSAKIDSATISNFFLTLLVSYFYLNKFKKVKELIGLINKNSHQYSSVNLGLYAKIITLIIRYEEKDVFYISSLAKSIYMWLYRKKLNEKTSPQIILKFMWHGAGRNGDLTKNAFRNLYRDLSKQRQDRYESYFFYEFDILVWIKSKIDNKPMFDIYKKMYKSED
ncbi:MAG: hypothetical protein J0M08_02415 [Bacteroidetes bacterium]|nr:hypothetical protein [Bacteroidota bacterium]